MSRGCSAYRQPFGSGALRVAGDPVGGMAPASDAKKSMNLFVKKLLILTSRKY
jgi:hypothetical protein